MKQLNSMGPGQSNLPTQNNFMNAPSCMLGPMPDGPAGLADHMGPEMAANQTNNRVPGLPTDLR